MELVVVVRVPELSVTVSAKVKVPARVGVPVIVCADPLIVSPFGSDPEASDQVYGLPVPPETYGERSRFTELAVVFACAPGVVAASAG